MLLVLVARLLFFIHDGPCLHHLGKFALVEVCSGPGVEEGAHRNVDYHQRGQEVSDHCQYCAVQSLLDFQVCFHSFFGKEFSIIE